MTLHLSSAELFECVAGGATESQRAHLDVCESCAATLRRDEVMVAGARSAISKWTDSLQGSDTAFLKRMREGQQRRARFRLVQLSAAVLLLTLVPAGLIERRHAERQRRQADEVLLRQVDEGIAEWVPTSMQPLNRLVAWSDDSKQQEQTKMEETR